jgi:hypothetical protein
MYLIICLVRGLVQTVWLEKNLSTLQNILSSQKFFFAKLNQIIFYIFTMVSWNRTLLDLVGAKLIVTIQMFNIIGLLKITYSSKSLTKFLRTINLRVNKNSFFSEQIFQDYKLFLPSLD